jgi:hypothetical protein
MPIQISVNGLAKFMTSSEADPFCDTSATSNYGKQTRGWLVHYPDGTEEERLCVTTRCD